MEQKSPIPRNPERQGHHDSDASPAVSDAPKTSMLRGRWIDCKHQSVGFLFRCRRISRKDWKIPRSTVVRRSSAPSPPRGRTACYLPV